MEVSIKPSALMLILLILILTLPVGSRSTQQEGEGFIFDERWRFKAEEGVREVAISLDGGEVVAGGKGYTAYFNVENGDPLWMFNRNDFVDSLAMSPEGEYIAVGMEHAMLHLFKGEEGLYWSLRTEGPVLCLSISDENQLTAGTFFGSIYSINCESKKVNWIYRLQNQEAVLSIAISLNGEVVAAGTSNDRILILNEDGEAVTDFKINGFPYSLELSNDGRLLAVASNSSFIYLFDLEGKRCVWSYKTGASVRSVDITSNGSFVVAGSHDGYVYCINIAGEVYWSYKTGGKVKEVFISPDDRLVFAGGTDRQVYAFKLGSGRCLASYRLPQWVTSISSSQDGDVVAIGARGYVILLDFTQSKSTSMEAVEEAGGTYIYTTSIALAIIAAIFITLLYRRWGSGDGDGK